MIGKTIILTALAATLAGCSDDEPSAAMRMTLAELPLQSRPIRETRWTPSKRRPEVPALMRQVHLINDPNGNDEADVTDDPDFLQPIIPPFRTSADGRIGIDLESSKFFLFGPEALRERVTAPVTGPDSPSGPDIIIDSVGPVVESAFYDVPYYEEWLAGGPGHAVALCSYALAHQTICDATPQKDSDPNTVLNPHPCGTGESEYGDLDDCYSLVVVSVVDLDTATSCGEGEGRKKKVQLWSRTITVVVTQPKTPDAKLRVVDPVEPYASGPEFFSEVAQDISITGDGRLIVFKLGKSKLDPHTGLRRGNEGIDVVYSVYPEGDAGPACDVMKWNTIKPMSEAHDDPNMRPRYGIADHPLRDPSDGKIPVGEDLRVSYPWIDKAGNNLFFTSIAATLYARQKKRPLTPEVPLALPPDIRSRYEAACISADECELEFPKTEEALETLEAPENFNGVGVVGSWTNGKMVLLDNAINNIDYGLGTRNKYQRQLLLYRNSMASAETDDVDERWVRAGTGRYPNGLALEVPLNSTENTSFIDSLEHLFFWDENLRPLAVRDVVWILNTGKVSAEVIFDDYIDPNAVIFAEMSGALGRSSDAAPGGEAEELGWLEYYDGFHQTDRGEIDFDRATPFPVRFQNAATSTTWKVPPFGVTHGEMRLEPVALGGIEGKGAWLDGDDDSITFDLDQSQAPVPKDYTHNAWYLGLFIDPRFENNRVPRDLFRFGSGDKIVLRGHDTIEYVDAGGGVSKLDIFAPALRLERGKWTHLAFVFDYPEQTTELYVNGFLARRDPGVLDLGGSLRVGSGAADLGDAAPAAFKGWIDELKLLAYRPSSELACNHARGTLMHVSEKADAWARRAADYPTFAHRAIQARLRAPLFAAQSYVCYHDYTEHRHANPRYAPPALESVRAALIFPGGPLVYDEPRPDSRENKFCLTCHERGAPGGLDLKSLAPDPDGLPMWRDPRRQPMNPPRMMHGNVPENLFGNGPPDHQSTRKHGIDQYVFPHPTP